MRWASVVGSGLLAGCLSAPPSSTGDPDGSPGPDASPPGSFALTGLAVRDPLTLDLRDELVLIGHREGSPVVIVLYPGDSELAEVAVRSVPLPFAPVDVVMTRWGSKTGLAIAFGPDGSLVAIDQNAASIRLEVMTDVSSGPVRQIAEVNQGGDRWLVLADDSDVFVSELSGTGDPGDSALAATWVVESFNSLFLGSSWDGAGITAIGAVAGDRGIHVHQLFTDGPTVGDNVVLDGARIPAGLTRATWRMIGTAMVLVGIDPATRALWYHRVSLADGSTVSSPALAGQFDVIHDLVITRLDDGAQELSLLVEEGGELEVIVYRDVASGTPDSLPTPIKAVVTGLEPPYWLQAMDVVLDLSNPGWNELLAYDAAGRVVCFDLLDDSLVSCGRLDLAAALSGVSTSGRPGW